MVEVIVTVKGSVRAVKAVREGRHSEINSVKIKVKTQSLNRRVR